MPFHPIRYFRKRKQDNQRDLEQARASKRFDAMLNPLNEFARGNPSEDHDMKEITGMLAGQGIIEGFFEQARDKADWEKGQGPVHKFSEMLNQYIDPKHPNALNDTRVRKAFRTEVVPELIRALGHDDPHIRYNALKYLKAGGYEAAEALPAVDAIMTKPVEDEDIRKLAKETHAIIVTHKQERGINK